MWDNVNNIKNSFKYLNIFDIIIIKNINIKIIEKKSLKWLIIWYSFLKYY